MFFITDPVLQEEKRKMVASAFGEDHGGGGASRLTVDDLKFLFTGVQCPPASRIS